MTRPQKYNPALGLQGNIEKSLWDNQYNKNDIYNNKASYDTDHIQMEQALTEAYLDLLQAQQDITDLYIEIIGG